MTLLTLKECECFTKNLFKKKQTYKPSSVSTKVDPYHLSRQSITQLLHLPTLQHRAGTLKNWFT
jgi:hypothetical protein